MIKGVLTGFIASVLFVSLIANSVPAFSQGNESPGKPEVIAVTGFIPGKDLIVHVLVEVQPGETRNEAAIAALAHQGARPITPAEYTTIAIHWDQFFDSVSGNEKVLQRYNTANDPSGISIGNSNHPFIKSQNSWTNVASSSFVFEFDKTTNKCPSLVKECRGPQKFDGFNDVAWMELNSPSTLGVTWTGTSTDEADMAMNTSFDWSTDNPASGYDIETVFLHENGHALGLGHENDVPSIMASYYSTINRVLYQDDIDGITFLYPGTSTLEPDADGDGVPDSQDKCPGFDDAIDVDADGIPDGCDTLIDSDGDGVGDVIDNCPDVSNPGQEDSDGNGVGDACEVNPGSLATEITPGLKTKGPNNDVSFTVKVTGEQGVVPNETVGFDITRPDGNGVKTFSFSGTTDDSGSVKFTVMKAYTEVCYTGTIVDVGNEIPSGDTSDEAYIDVINGQRTLTLCS